MNIKTEDDIPGLFRQFSGNSANYQELTRAAAARASQARWPLLSAVELEQGDIPAVIEPTAMQIEAVHAMADAPAPAMTPPAVTPHVPAPPRVGPSRVVPFQGAASEAEARPQADMDMEAPKPIVLPGNTIFMAPAANTARHFAQLERALGARRETAPPDIVVAPAAQDEVIAPALRSEPPVLVHVIAPAVAMPETPLVPVAALPEPTKHAGLKPIFARLAGEPEEATSAVDSLFNRLLQS